MSGFGVAWKRAAASICWFKSLILSSNYTMGAIGPLLKQEIENSFEIIRSRSNHNELTFICPQPGCGDTNGNRSVNLKNGKTNCWRCNVGGDFVQWAKRLGLRFANAGDLTSTMSLKELFNIKPEVRSILPVVAKVKLPEGFTPLAEQPKSVYTRLIGEMAERKNLRLQDFIEAGCGFTRKDALWEPFAIFPVFEYDTPVYYQGRTYAEQPGERTKKFPSNREVKYGAKYWIYNIDEARKKKANVLIIVESILNVLSLKWYLRDLGVDNVVPVAAFKHKVSLEQYYKMWKLPHVEEICLLFDHDAIKESWKDASKFTNKFSITVAEMPAGDDNKKLDPNDDVALAWQTFGKRKDFRRYHALSAAHDGLQELMSERNLRGDVLDPLQ
jgi:hypothetical protein